MLIPFRMIWNLSTGITRHAIAKKANKYTPGSFVSKPSIFKGRAFIGDCDTQGHFTEDAYFRCVENSLWFALGANGTVPILLKNGWFFVFGSQSIRRFNGNLTAMQPYEVHSTMSYWDDDKWFYLESQVKCPDTGKVYAECINKAIMRKGRERLDARLLVKALGMEGYPDPEMSDSIRTYIAWENEIALSMSRKREAVEQLLAAKKKSKSSSMPELPAFDSWLPRPRRGQSGVPSSIAN